MLQVNDKNSQLITKTAMKVGQILRILFYTGIGPGSWLIQSLFGKSAHLAHFLNPLHF